LTIYSITEVFSDIKVITLTFLVGYSDKYAIRFSLISIYGCPLIPVLILINSIVELI